MRKLKQICSIVFTLCLMLFIVGCGSSKAVETVRIGALKGPTSMGLLHLLEEQETAVTKTYEFTMATGADELMPLLVKGELDIALVPSNVAANMYQKTEGKIQVLDINTLGVLYLVSGDSGIQSVSDLSGKIVYLTGQGTTPDYVLQYLLDKNGVTDCTLEYKSEATEVAAMLANNPEAVGFLPQPFVSAALMQNETLQVVGSAQEEWTKVTGEGYGIVTGVTVVRKDFYEQNKKLVDAFLQEHRESVEWINTNVEDGAALCVKAGIVGKEPIARKAIPQCNITCVSGTEMRTMLQAYLDVLYEMDPASVGGKLPLEDFYLAR